MINTVVETEPQRLTGILNYLQLQVESDPLDSGFCGPQLNHPVKPVIE